MSDRIVKVNELIRQVVAEEIVREVDSSGLVTVKAVDTAPDMKNAVIWISILGDEEKAVLERIEEKKREIQQTVNKKMFSKNVPALDFRIDHSGQYAEKIDKILRGISNRKK